MLWSNLLFLSHKNLIKILTVYKSSDAAVRFVSKKMFLKFNNKQNVQRLSFHFGVFLLNFLITNKCATIF